ncbi:MAG: phosphoglycerate kinase [Rickettsiales bacterium]|jgi:phosphoglycerate kinase|nr:phosphoglycerate kinase [Rickettsiales bacterium]
MTSTLPSLETLDVTGKTVLVRLDLNVPMQRGRVVDATRITRIIPTLQYLIERHAKIVVLSHLGRPGGFDPGLSLAPLVDILSENLWDRPVKFSPDCVGSTARLAVEAAAPGDVILMENLRFHAEEEANDPTFGKALASLGDAFVNDAFSCSHRAHASIVGINPHLPSAAGRLLAEEAAALSRTLSTPNRPLAALVGGSKVSTKITLLGNLCAKVDKLIIGGAMANTFLYAQGYDVGASWVEPDMKSTVRDILKEATSKGCALILPSDVVVASAFEPHAPAQVVEVKHIPKRSMILDIGPRSLMQLFRAIEDSRTLVWNGPVGAYETAPFDSSTVQLARMVAARSREGLLHSVAGGGDTVAALAHAGLTSELSYLSTAGGAFLEWLEGKELPGIAALLGAYDARERQRA